MFLRYVSIIKNKFFNSYESALDEKSVGLKIEQFFIKEYEDFNPLNLDDIIPALPTNDQTSQEAIKINEIIKQYNLQRYFKEWIKNSELTDDLLKGSLPLLHKIGVIDKKKESNRIFWRAKGTNVEQNLIDYFKQFITMDESYSKQISLANVKMLSELYNDTELVEFIKITPSTEETKRELLLLANSDFFGCGNGVYPKSEIPLLSHLKYGSFKYQPHFKQFSRIFLSKEYEQLSKKMKLSRVKNILFS